MTAATSRNSILPGGPAADVAAIVVLAVASGWAASSPENLGFAAPLSVGIIQGALFLGWGWASWRLARERKEWERTAWLLFAACVPITVVIAIVALALGVPLDGGADPIASLLSLALYAVLFWGLLVLNLGRARSSNAWRRGLDAAIIAGCLFFTLWGALYRDAFQASTLPAAARAAVLVTPFLDAALVSLAALALAVPDKSRPRGYAFMLSGLLVIFVSDLLGTTLKLSESAFALPLTTASGVTAIGLFGLSAILLRRQPAWLPEAPREEALWVRMLPVFALVPAMGSAAVTVVEHGALSPIQFWTAFAVIGLVLLQLALTVRQAKAFEDGLRAESDFKTQLLRFISHEVANPLSPLRVQVSLLGKNPPPDQTRSWSIVQRSLDRLLALSKDVREMALAETQRLVTNVEVADAGEQVAAGAQAAVSLAKERGLELVMHTPLEPLTTRLDVQRFGQVVDNLLSNAMKFTHAPGKITVRVEKDGNLVRVRVTDTGIGLSPADRDGLFQPFRRAQDGAAPGLGLGLYICKAIMTGLHGAIGVESAGRGQGATFWAALPLEGTDPDPLPLGRTQVAPPLVEPAPTATVKLA